MAANQGNSSFWADALPWIEPKLEEALRSLEAREQEVSANPAMVDWGTALEQVRGRIAGLEGCADRVGPLVSGADQETSVEETALRELVATAESLRRRLADWPGRAIG